MIFTYKFCHFVISNTSSMWLHRIIIKGFVLCLVAQSCLTLCDPVDCILPGSSVHGDSPGKNRSGLPCPLPGNLPNPEIEPRSPTLQEDSLPLEPPGKPCNVLKVSKIKILISAREIEIHF